MAVSIALATYNGERYLQEQLESYASQTLLPDELVVCDDASHDGTWSILESFAQAAPFPVRLFSNERNLGFGSNFAQAVELATGDVIFMSDQDDVWLPSKLERVTAAFDVPEVMVVTCDQEIVDEKLNLSGQTSQGLMRSLGARNEMFTIGCCTAIRSALRGVLLPLPPGVDSHDTWLALLAKSLDVQRLVPEVLQYHRRHGDNITADQLNPLGRIGRLGMLRRWYAISPDQLVFVYPYYEAVVDRLASAPRNAFPFPDRRDRGLEWTQRRLATMRERHAIALRPRWRRFPAVVRLLCAGDYGQFSGWKSVAKDVLAKRMRPA